MFWNKRARENQTPDITAEPASQETAAPAEEQKTTPQSVPAPVASEPASAPAAPAQQTPAPEEQTEIPIIEAPGLAASATEVRPASREAIDTSAAADPVWTAEEPVPAAEPETEVEEELSAPMQADPVPEEPEAPAQTPIAEPSAASQVRAEAPSPADAGPDDPDDGGPEDLEEQPPKRSKKGVVLVILMILFAAVIAADLVNLALTSDTDSGAGEFTMVDMSEMDFSDVDMSSFAAGFSQDGDTASENDSASESRTSSGGASSEMTRGGSSAEFGSAMTAEDTEDDAEDSADSSAESFGGMAAASDSTGVFMRIRTFARQHWLPILAVAALGELISLILLIRVRKKRKMQERELFPEEEEPIDIEELVEARRRKSRRMWVIPLVAVVVIAIAVTVLPMLMSSTSTDSSTVTVESSVISGTAEADTITTALSGAGTLEDEDAVTLSIPEAVTISAYHVQNGDTVEAGDIIASVDTITVATAIVELQDVIDELDEELEEEAEEEAETDLTATVAGRVKVIYAEEDVDVADTIYEYGALMLLSLDGEMAVQFESDAALTVDDTVTVTYSDGTSEDGRVASVKEGIVTITVSDETAAYQDEVTVYDENGDLLGSGTLYIHSELKIMGYYGTVTDIDVSENEEVDAGDTLMTLSYSGHTSTYTALLNRRYELEDQMEALFQYYTDGYIYAETDGVVSGISDDATYVSLTEETADTADTAQEEASVTETRYSGSSGSAAVLTTLSYSGSGSSGGATITLLKATEDDTEATATPAPTTTTEAETTATPESTTGATATPEPTATTEAEATATPEPTAEATATPEPVSTEEAEATATPEPTDTGEAESEDTVDAPEFDGTEINYVAVITANEENTLTYTSLVQETEIEDYEALDYMELSALLAAEDAETEIGQCSYDDTTEVTVYTYVEDGETWETSKLSDLAAGDLVVLVFTKNEEDAEVLKYVILVESTDSSASGEMSGTDSTDGTDSMSGMSGSSGGGSSSGSASMSGSSGSVSASGMTEEETYAYETYSVAEQDVLSITPQDEVMVTITIDELDILELSVGLEAEVTLDALKGQSFTGTVDYIATTGTNEGGNTKFSVEVTIPRTSQMLAGMNVSVEIVTDTTEASVTIPVAALVEDNGRTYVYTEYDESTDTLSGLTEVETGMSDGDVVEILSGMEEGDTYYYRYADTLSYTFVN
ncbi:MAG: HlyD family efflux transporter periplasmic adaptor subunit [Oscillospiraceae bacterium]|nr:HlyD family efflux transporter periplasmic adaptor subunit [Oscillospiraceae bacterium]